MHAGMMKLWDCVKAFDLNLLHAVVMGEVNVRVVDLCHACINVLLSELPICLDCHTIKVHLVR
jgi:hypothetical protein